MALRNIVKDGDPGLLKVSRRVKDFNRRLHILIDDMRETLISANGLGIAAPQVGVLRRVALIVDLPAVEETVSDTDSTSAAQQPADTDNAEDRDISQYIVELINPKIVYQEGEQCGSEGCLSLPGVYGMITRPQIVKIKAQDRNGKEFEMEAKDMTARAICHEIDHLDGIFFTSIAERILTNEEVEEIRGK